jgi:spermidine/putrescine transport system permease protein
MTALATEPRPPQAAAKTEKAKGLGFRRASLPYLMLAPGILWLIIFFIVPMFTVFTSSVETGNIDQGYILSWRWANFSDVLSGSGSFMPEIMRSLEYSVVCTALCILLAFPLAYFIAFKAGRWKNLLMALVIAPFFTSYLIRTIAWETILADNSTVVHIMNDLGITPLLYHLGLTNSDHTVMQSTTSLIAGMVYNFLPFTVLPLYTSLEKIDPRLHEAGADLYGSPWRTFRKVTVPLAMPGVVGGTLLTFIPAIGDYTNAQILGGPKNTVIGTTIENQMIQTGDTPHGAALSVLLMVGTLIMVMVYIKKAGTEELL